MSEQQYNTNPPKIDIPDNVLESAGFIGSGKLKFREYSLGFIKELFEKSFSLANVDSINNIREVTGDHVREAAQKVYGRSHDNTPTLHIILNVLEYVFTLSAGLGGGNIKQSWGILVFCISVALGVVCFIIRRTTRKN